MSNRKSLNYYCFGPALRHLRTAIFLTLCCIPGGMFLLGPDCSSWTLISRGTSWRHVANFWGNMNLEWVRGSNLMISRSIWLQFSLGEGSKCVLMIIQDPTILARTFPINKHSF